MHNAAHETSRVNHSDQPEPRYVYEYPFWEQYGYYAALRRLHRRRAVRRWGAMILGAVVATVIVWMAK